VPALRSTRVSSRSSQRRKTRYNSPSTRRKPVARRCTPPPNYFPESRAREAGTRLALKTQITRRVARIKVRFNRPASPVARVTFTNGAVKFVLVQTVGRRRRSRLRPRTSRGNALLNCKPLKVAAEGNSSSETIWGTNRFFEPGRGLILFRVTFDISSTMG
jgi:hypothetical protein